MIRQEAGESGNSSEDENFPDGPPSKISTLKRDDIDRIYSEYVKITLKSSENTKAKPLMVVKSTKSDGSGNPERVKRKYKKRQKEQHVVQNNSVSLLKPAGQSQPGQNYTINQNGTELAQRQQPIGFHDQFDRTTWLCTLCKRPDPPDAIVQEMTNSMQNRLLVANQEINVKHDTLSTIAFP
jgi:hypothetical protein